MSLPISLNLNNKSGEGGSISQPLKTTIAEAKLKFQEEQIINLDWMVQDLAKSGLVIEDFDPKLEPNGDGYKILYPECNGWYRSKVNTDKKTTCPKYLSPKNAGIRIFIPVKAKESLLANSKDPLTLTEGEKKSLASTKKGIPCLGLPGIWGWMQSKDKRKSEDEIHPDLIPYLKDERDFILIYDSDAIEESKYLDFKDCSFRFAEQLSKFDCKLYQVILPLDGSSKVGLDDFLLLHSKEELLTHIERSKSLINHLDTPPRLKAKIDSISKSIELIPEDIDHLNLPKLLQPILKSIAEIEESYCDPFLSKIEHRFKLKRITTYRQKITKLRKEKLSGKKETQNWKNIPEIEAIIKKFGEPIVFLEKGFRLNQEFFPNLAAAQHRMLYENTENQFYIYHENSGLWKFETESKIVSMISDTFIEFFTEFFPLCRDDFLAIKTHGFLKSCIEMLKGRIETNDVFSKIGKKFIHVQNGVIDMSDPSNMSLKSFSYNWYSRNQLPIAYDAKATCPRFINELLAPQLDKDDMLLLQKYCGNIILGGNLIQRLIILSGLGGTGKGTITEIIELIVGRENTAQLRTQNLNERFELSFYLGKTLLGGKDVPGEFLQHKGAKVVKTLVGHDWLLVEFKNGRKAANLRGEFSIIINCNDKLRVILEGDIEAWQRRLLILEFK